jgi:lipid-A-disaccharide synthase-like uncharacterized protein
MLHPTTAQIWLTIGLLGQGLFFMRFFLQWLASEKAGRSVIPIAFWWFSVAGGLTLLIYALWRRDPVFIIGQASGFLIYARNLYLVNKEQRLAGVSNEDPQLRDNATYCI